MAWYVFKGCNRDVLFTGHILLPIDVHEARVIQMLTQSASRKRLSTVLACSSGVQRWDLSTERTLFCTHAVGLGAVATVVVFSPHLPCCHTG